MTARGTLLGLLLTALLLALGTGMTSAAATAQSSPENAGYSAAVTYNQANAEARGGNTGMAVLDYERARLLAPRDQDVRANLKTVRDTSGLAPSSGGWFDRLTEFADPNILFWLGCFGILIAGTSELARRLYSTHRRGLRAASFAGLALTLVTVCNAAAVWPTVHEAVVIVSTTSARGAPTTLAEPLTVLREGEIVSVEAARAQFALVRTNQGLTGWVARADLARVVPEQRW